MVMVRTSHGLNQVSGIVCEKCLSVDGNTVAQDDSFGELVVGKITDELCCQKSLFIKDCCKRLKLMAGYMVPLIIALWGALGTDALSVVIY